MTKGATRLLYGACFVGCRSGSHPSTHILESMFLSPKIIAFDVCLVGTADAAVSLTLVQNPSGVQGYVLI